MPVTANQILAYQGDANSALATDSANGGPWGVVETPQLNQAARDLAIFAVQKNKSLYDQRVKDRDQVEKMIDDEALIPTDVLPTDQSRIDGQRQKIQDIFKKYNGDILNDPQRFREYVNQIQQTKQDIKTAQKRYIGVQADKMARSKSDNPVEQSLIDQHIQDQLQKSSGEGYGNQYTPYAPFTSFEIDKVAPTPTYITKSSRWDGSYKIDEQVLDADKLSQTLRENWAKEDYNHYFTNKNGTGYLDMLLHPDVGVKMIPQINAGIAKYNQDLGLHPGDKGYVEDLSKDIVGDPKSGYHLMSSPADVATKIVIGTNQAKKVTKEFDDKKAANSLGYGKLAEETRHNKATEGIDQQKINDERDKWQTATKNAAGDKSAAWSFAQSKVNELYNLSDNGVIDTDKVRQLNSEQLKYLGSYQEIDGKKTWVPMFKVLSSDGKTLKDMTVPGDDKKFMKDEAIIQVGKEGTIKVLRVNRDKNNNIEKTASGKILGEYIPGLSTNLSNIATQRLTDENINSSGKESNNFLPIDLQGTAGGVGTSGGSQSSSQSGSSTNSFNVNGKIYSRQALNAMGYSDDQIKKYQDAGIIK